MQKYLDHLRGLPDSDVFLYLNLYSDYIITVKTGKDFVKLLIRLLEPVFPCVTTGMLCGLVLAYTSIYHMFYSYKKIILAIRREGENSELLLHVWKFGSYNTIFFCAQFIVNCFFLEYLVGISLFFICYALSFKEFLLFLWSITKALPISFWIGLVPVTLG